MPNNYFAVDEGDQAGFPNDDQNALQQLAYGGNLNVFYVGQLVQNEKHEVEILEINTHMIVLDYTPVIKGTITGHIKRGNDIIQTFVVPESGIIGFSSVHHDAVVVENAWILSGSVDHLTGEVVLLWNGFPGKYEISFSYEYNIEKVKKAKPVKETMIVMSKEDVELINGMASVADHESLLTDGGKKLVARLCRVFRLECPEFG